jgi:hypothetical protein
MVIFFPKPRGQPKAKHPKDQRTLKGINSAEKQRKDE